MHDVIKFSEILDTDIIEIIPCVSDEHCRSLERDLIIKYKPKFNKRIPLGLERVSILHQKSSEKKSQVETIDTDDEYPEHNWSIALKKDA